MYVYSSHHFSTFYITKHHPTRCFFFFFNDTATTEIYTLSLHDALPISIMSWPASKPLPPTLHTQLYQQNLWRSEEHTSELQSRPHLVCRLLLEKKKRNGTVELLLRECTKS